MQHGDAPAAPDPRVLSHNWPIDAPVPLVEDEVRVWWIDLRIPPERRTALANILDDHERHRASAFKYDAHQRRFIARRAARREILASFIGVHPGDLRFASAPRGRPSLAHPAPPFDLRFSASHSEELAVVAVARSRDVGIDIEALRPIDDLEQLLAEITSPEERRTVNALPPGDRTGAFFRCWTAKEAYLKATGEGLSRPLHSFSVLTDPARPLALVSVPGLPACRFHDLSRPTFAATLAVLDR